MCVRERVYGWMNVRVCERVGAWVHGCVCERERVHWCMSVRVREIVRVCGLILVFIAPAPSERGRESGRVDAWVRERQKVCGCVGAWVRKTEREWVSG